MRRFFSKKPKYIQIIEQAYASALVSESSKKGGLSISDIEKKHTHILFIETLDRLVQAFRSEKHARLVQSEEDEILLQHLSAQLSEFHSGKHVSLTDILETLKANLYNIKPGWFNRGVVYPAFASTLVISVFHETKLFRSAERAHATRQKKWERHRDALIDKEEKSNQAAYRASDVNNKDILNSLSDAAEAIKPSSSPVSFKAETSEGSSNSTRGDRLAASVFGQRQTDNKVPAPAASSSRSSLGS